MIKSMWDMHMFELVNRMSRSDLVRVRVNVRARMRDFFACVRACVRARGSLLREVEVALRAAPGATTIEQRRELDGPFLLGTFF